jgi:hypothetical protein
MWSMNKFGKSHYMENRFGIFATDARRTTPTYGTIAAVDKS